MSDYLFLQSENITLKQIEPKDLKELSKKISKWINDGVVTYYMFTGQKPRNSEQISNDFKKLLETDHNVIFLIADKKTGESIGYAGLYEINPSSRKAEFRILIGEKNFWGKGLGTEITELITYYGFDRLNLHRIYLGFTADNQAAKRAYEKAGYKHEGTLKDDIYRNSRFYDSARMAILRDDYYKKFYKKHEKRFSPKNNK